MNLEYSAIREQRLRDLCSVIMPCLAEMCYSSLDDTDDGRNARWNDAKSVVRYYRKDLTIGSKEISEAFNGVLDSELPSDKKVLSLAKSPGMVNDVLDFCDVDKSGISDDCISRCGVAWRKLAMNRFDDALVRKNGKTFLKETVGSFHKLADHLEKVFVEHAMEKDKYAVRWINLYMFLSESQGVIAAIATERMNDAMEDKSAVG